MLNGISGSRPILLAQAEVVKEKPMSDAKKAAVARMRAAGIKLYDSDIEQLSDEQAKDKVYIDTIIMLHKKGAYINGGMFRYFSQDDARNKKFIDVLLKLQSKGIIIDWSIANSLKDWDGKYGKAYSSVYVDSIIKMHKAGIQTDSEFIERFTYWKDDKTTMAFADALIRLHKEGINVRREGANFISDKLTIEEGKCAKYYIDALVKLHNNGVDVTGDLVESMSLDEARNPAYIQKLINEAKK